MILLSALAAVALITSCNNDNDEATVNDGSVRFTAGIGSEAVATPTTRAAGTTWGARDKIGVFMVARGTDDVAERADNRMYTTSGDGNFSTDAANMIYYPMNNSPVDFIAYYPHRDGASLDAPFTVDIATTQTDGSQPGFDFLWARADNSGAGYKKSDADDPALNFTHSLAKLTMNCKVHSSVGNASLLDDATVTIHGTLIHGTFDLKTGKPTGRHPANTPADITPRRLAAVPAGFHAAYDAILLPGNYAHGLLTVDFNLDGEIFTWDVESIEFEPGHEYIYEVTITYTGVTANGTIKPWTQEVKGPVTAE